MTILAQCNSFCKTGESGRRALEVVQVLLGGQAVRVQLLAVLEGGLVVAPATWFTNKSK